MSTRKRPPSKARRSSDKESNAKLSRENNALRRDLEERNAELREALSIRPRHPKCSASSAARRPTCSRCSMPSSRAPRGFAGLMMWCCGSTRGTAGFAGSFWSDTHRPR